MNPSACSRSNNGRWIAKVATVGCAGVLGLVLSSCGTNPSGRSIGVQTVPSSPGVVARQYAVDFFSGRFNAANLDVAVSQRALMPVLSAGITPGSVSEHNIQVGSVDITLPTADVVLTGQLCSTGSKQKLTSKAKCIQNTDPHSKNPIFVVHLVKIARKWYVNFPVPPAGSVNGPCWNSELRLCLTASSGVCLLGASMSDDHRADKKPLDLDEFCDVLAQVVEMDVNRIAPEAHLHGDLDLDSLHLLEFYCAISDLAELEGDVPVNIVTGSSTVREVYLKYLEMLQQPR